MERSANEQDSSRVRELLDRLTGPWEVAAITAATIAVWRIALGWDWSGVPSTDPLRSVARQSGTDWLILGFAVAAGVGWLAWRGHGISGIASIWLSVIVLSGWRMSVSAVLGWPIDLAALIFVISALCIAAGSIGTWLRIRADRRDAFTHYVDFGDDDFPVDKPLTSGSPRR